MRAEMQVYRGAQARGSAPGGLIRHAFAVLMVAAAFGFVIYAVAGGLGS